IGGFLFLLMWMSLQDLFELLPIDYAEGAGVAWVIGLAYVLNTSVGLNMGIISMSRSYRLDAWSSIGMLVINIVANFFLVRSMGIIGAAWSTLLSLVLVNIFRTVYLYRKYGLWPFRIETLKVVGLVVLIGSIFPWIPLMGKALADIILRSVLIAFVYAGIGYLVGLFNEIGPFWMRYLRRN